MAKRTTVGARAKGIERTVQQLLWPGTVFAGHAKRPALEDQDVCGLGCDDWPWWGEVKNYGQATIRDGGGTWAVLEKALEQAGKAILRNVQVWPTDGAGLPVRPKPFAVLWPSGSRREDQRLAMCEYAGARVVMPLHQFKRLFVDGPSE